jgi:hypothetical protein
MGPVHDCHCGCADEQMDAALDKVCSMPPAEREPRRARMHDLVARTTGWAPRHDGVVLQFAGSADTARTVLEFVLAERQCCPHFTYELGFAPDHQRVTLRLRANGAFVALLKAIYAGLAAHR